MRVKSNSKRGIFAPGDGQPRGSGHVGWLKMQKKSKYIRVQPGHKELPGWHRESCQHSELRHWCHTPLLIRQMRTYLCTAFPGMQWCSGKVLAERVPPTSTLTITRYRTNTQKSEATHRRYSISNPKNVTCARNFQPQIFSAIHRINHGPGKSAAMKCAALGAPITEGTRVCRQLQRKQKKHEQDQTRKRLSKYRAKRQTLVKQKFQM